MFRGGFKMGKGGLFWGFVVIWTCGLAGGGERRVFGFWSALGRVKLGRLGMRLCG